MGKPKITGPCSAPDCEEPHYSRGYCRLHYQRLRRAGELPTQTLTVEQRFWKNVDKSGDCWIWTAGCYGRTGYGQFWDGTTGISAHRFSFRLANGPIPDGMLVDHTCHERRCVRPEHLRLATNKQNQENRIGPAITNRSGVRGVYWDKGAWVASVGHNGELHRGRFAALQDAEAFARRKRNELFTHNNLDKAAP